MFKITLTTLLIVFYLSFGNAQEISLFQREAREKLETLEREFVKAKDDYNKYITTTIGSIDPSKAQLEALKQKRLIVHDLLEKATVVRVMYMDKGVSIEYLNNYFKPSKKLRLLEIPYALQPENSKRFELYKISLEKAFQKYYYRDRENYDGYKEGQNYVVQNKLLTKIIDTVFNQIVFSSDNLVNNASAFGFSQNEEKTTISANANLKYKTRLFDYIKVGVAATGKGANFNLYSRNSWSQSSGASIGGIKQLGTRSLSIKDTYSQEDYEKDQKGRLIAANKILREKSKYSRAYLKNLTTLADGLDEETTIDITNPPYKELFTDYPDLKKLIITNSYGKAFDKIEEIKKEILIFLKLDGSAKSYDTYIENIFETYETAHNPITTSYNLCWIDYGISLAYTTFNFTEDNIAPTIEPSFGADREVNSSLFKASANFNWSRQGKETITYLQAGLGFQSGSFLNSNLIVGTPTIATIVGEDFKINDERTIDNSIGSYNDIKRSLQIMDVHAYGAFFFTKRKNFGFNLSYRHNLLIKEPNSVNYYKNFSLLGGPIFKIADGKTAGTSFGIDIGFENAAYEGNIQDEFTARLRIGIPFNIYSKKSEEKK